MTHEIDEFRSRPVTRRSFTIGAIGAAAMLGLGGAKYLPEASLVRPPGGQVQLPLINACIHCEKCREVCPKTAIVTAHIESGLLNARTPRMGFRNGWCDFCEEVEGGPRCAAVCPTGALDLLRGDSEIIGKAYIEYDWCLAYRGMGCDDCVDACDYDALVLTENGNPQVIEDKCNGCGKCEYVCISQTAGSLQGATDRAITIKPVDVFEELKAQGQVRQDV